MDFVSRMQAGVQVISVAADRIDAAVAIQFKDQMRALTEDGAPRVLLDLSQVGFLDSSGLGAVVAAMKHLGADRKLDLAGLTPPVERVFRLTRMETIFAIFPDIESALRPDASVA